MRRFGGIFDIPGKIERLKTVNAELEDPAVWGDQKRASALGKERTLLDTTISRIEKLSALIDDTRELLTLSVDEQDEASFASVTDDVEHILKTVAEVEFARMFSGEMDPNNAYLEVQSGSGGTEAQDWAEMLLRMYLRWGERRGFKTELIEASAGEVAGIKSATVKFTGEYAYGWLRTENGVHRLVRKSPFDSGNRRHTSFASIFVTPEVDDNVDIEINPADIRVDTYRASGAGGQHVNTTDSAIRITHEPTGIVVQCQSDRSQHRNKAEAMKQLRAKLYEIEMNKRTQEQQALEAAKSDIGWGSQIRSYVLDQSRIKDLRTGVEVGDTTKVLDGDIDIFIESALKGQVS